MGQHTLGIHPAAPEDEILPEFVLERDRVHPPGAYVHRVENLYPNLDIVGQQGPHVATRVEETFCIRSQILDPLKQDLEKGLDLLAEHSR